MSTDHDRRQAGPASEDPALVRAWREASDEQPPARLDATILDAARRSVEMEDARAKARRVEQRTRSRWMQWQPLAAAATVAGLAFVLVQTLPREREVAPPIRMQVPEPAPALERDVTPALPREVPAAPPAPAVSRESQGDAPAPGVDEAPAELDAGRPLRERSVAGAAAAPPPAEAAPDVPALMRSAEAEQRKGVMADEAREAYSQEAAAPAAGRTPTPAPGTAAARSATDWASRIEALHASGDLAGAAAALREFRAIDPDADARLPESLQEWARTVE